MSGTRLIYIGDKVLNVETGRYVLKHGKIGHSINSNYAFIINKYNLNSLTVTENEIDKCIKNDVPMKEIVNENNDDSDTLCKSLLSLTIDTNITTEISSNSDILCESLEKLIINDKNKNKNVTKNIAKNVAKNLEYDSSNLIINSFEKLAIETSPKKRKISEVSDGIIENNIDIDPISVLTNSIAKVSIDPVTTVTSPEVTAGIVENMHEHAHTQETSYEIKNKKLKELVCSYELFESSRKDYTALRNSMYYFTSYSNQPNKLECYFCENLIDRQAKYEKLLSFYDQEYSRNHVPEIVRRQNSECYNMIIINWNLAIQLTHEEMDLIDSARHWLLINNTRTLPIDMYYAIKKPVVKIKGYSKAVKSIRELNEFYRKYVVEEYLLIKNVPENNNEIALCNNETVQCSKDNKNNDIVLKDDTIVEGTRVEVIETV